MSEDTPTLRTRSAHWGYEDHRYFGHAVFADLRGKESMAGLTALSVLGRRLSAQACELLDEAAQCLRLLSGCLTLGLSLAARAGYDSFAAVGRSRPPALAGAGRPQALISASLTD